MFLRGGRDTSVWERQRKGVCSMGEQLMEAQTRCRGAGMPVGAEPHLHQGLQTTMQGQSELCTGLVLLLQAAARREHLSAVGTGSALLVLPCFSSAWGLAGNVRAKVGAEQGCACSSLAGNHHCLAPWALSLPMPETASLNFHLHILQALPDSPCWRSSIPAGGPASPLKVQGWGLYSSGPNLLAFFELPPFCFLRQAH